MSRKELPIRFKAYPHANDNGSVSGSPPDPRLLSLARLIARAAVRDLIDGQTANDNADNLTVAGRHPLKGTEQVSANSPSGQNPEIDPSLIAEPVSADEPLEEIIATSPAAKSTQAPHTPTNKRKAHAPRLKDLPAGTQLYLFPDLNPPRDSDDH
ncbi:hypothetical protein [Flagellimonas sp.]|uniref:hypothetical protein n=1 Tax=Flagellimonas sp. TaxID=2058762 RepID=UPI003AB696BB